MSVDPWIQKESGWYVTELQLSENNIDNKTRIYCYPYHEESDCNLKCTNSGVCQFNFRKNASLEQFQIKLDRDGQGPVYSEFSLGMR